MLPQSYLWNAAASHRVERYGGTAVVAGDLVLPASAAAAAAAAGKASRPCMRLSVSHAGALEWHLPLQFCSFYDHNSNVPCEALFVFTCTCVIYTSPLL